MDVQLLQPYDSAGTANSKGRKSVFIEHLEDPLPPSQAELEAYDCFHDPYLAKRRLSHDVSATFGVLPSPRDRHPVAHQGSPVNADYFAHAYLLAPSPAAAATPTRSRSPQALLSQSYSHSSSARADNAGASRQLIPSLVRRLSQSTGGSRRPRTADGSTPAPTERKKSPESSSRSRPSPWKHAPVNRAHRTSKDDGGIAWSPRLAKEHPSPRPLRRAYSTHDKDGRAKHSERLEQESSDLLQVAPAETRISFADEARRASDVSMEGARGSPIARKDASPQGASQRNEFLQTRDDDDISASLAAFTVKRFSMPAIPSVHARHAMEASNESDPARHTNDLLAPSPVEQRRRSFESSRNSLLEQAHLHHGQQRPRAASPLSQAASSDIFNDESPERDGRSSSGLGRSWFGNRKRDSNAVQGPSRSFEAPQYHAFNAHGTAPVAATESMQAVDSSISPRFAQAPPARPSHPKRSLSASFISLGKIVANLATSSSSSSLAGRSLASPRRNSPSHDKALQRQDRLEAGSPSFKVHGVHRVSPLSPGLGIMPGELSPRASLSLSVGPGGSRPSSPLVTASPVLADGADGVDADGGIPASSLNAAASTARLIVEGRPPLMRNAKSEGLAGLTTLATMHGAGIASASLTSPSTHTVRTSSTSLFLSPTRPAISRTPSSTSREALTRLPDAVRGEDEDWLASLRGRPTARRMSAADLFAPTSPRRSPVGAIMMPVLSPPRVSEEQSRTSRSGSSSPLRFGTSDTEPAVALDFSKKPVSVSSAGDGSDGPKLSGGATQSGGAGDTRQRTTSYSSLLSSSRPNTAAAIASSATRAFPSLPSSPTPGTAPHFSARKGFAPLGATHRHTHSLPAASAAAEVALAHGGPAGAESSVLDANHAKFMAVLTAAAAPAAAPSVTFAPSTNDTESGEDGETGTAPQRMANPGYSPANGRLPKLSYGTASSADGSAMQIGFEPHRRTALSASSSASSSMLVSPTSPSGVISVPKQPIFSSSSNRSSRAGSPDHLTHTRGSQLGKRDYGMPAMWVSADKNALEAPRRENNKSDDSGMTVLTGRSSEGGEGEDDPFRPRIAVW